MKRQLERGVLIVFEGIDGSGKSTQAKLLKERLTERGFDVVFFQEPSKSKWGNRIRKRAVQPDSLTPEEELNLFVKDRKENIKKNLKPALKEEKVIILDRYYYSTIAYQGAKGIDEDMIREIHDTFVLEADLVFIFDLDPRIALERIKPRRTSEVLFEREDYLVEVRKIYKSLEGDNIIHLDGTEPEEIIFEKIEQIVLPYLDKKAKSEK